MASTVKKVHLGGGVLTTFSAKESRVLRGAGSLSELYPSRRKLVASRFRGLGREQDLQAILVTSTEQDDDLPWLQQRAIRKADNL